jgi:DNA-binding response OmpR family regulator
MEAGLRVEKWATASAGIELYEDFQPDLINLNALVPGGGGYEVCQAIRDSIATTRRRSSSPARSRAARSNWKRG